MCHAGRETRQGVAGEAVQTFCTSFKLSVRLLKRPETGRSRRRLGAWPALSFRTRRRTQAARRLAWEAGSGRSNDRVRCSGDGDGLAGRADRARPGRRGPAGRAGPQGESRPSSARRGGAQSDGPPLQAQGRFASRATALRAALDLGASATLGAGWSQGRPVACPHQVAHRRTRHPLGVPFGCQGGLDYELTSGRSAS